MALSGDQQHVLSTILRIGQRRGATPKQIKAAIETGLVESGLRNLPGGSGDSAGWRQERSSLYPDPTNLSASVNRFFDETAPLSAKYGRAGDLAAAVQRPRADLRGKYQERSGDADTLMAHLGVGSAASRGDNSGLATRLTGSVTPGQLTGGGFDPGTPPDVSSLADLLSKPQPQTPQLPAAPFSTSKYLHLGNSPVVTPQAPQGGLEDALAAVQSSGQEIPQTSVSAAKTTVSGSADDGPTATASRAGTGRSPTARSGKLIGFPHQGTHTLGNWQSDNAVDIKVPEGTPMVSLQDGVVVKVRHHPQDGSRFAGDQITVRGANGNEYFYAHGHASVRPGQRISKGQSLGVTGSANGVAHLHFGQMRGDPRQHVRSR